MGNRKMVTTYQGTTISFLDNERTNKPTLLFIHGNSQSADIWEGQYQDKNLEENFRLIAVDLPYHGDSSEIALQSNTLSIAALGNAIRDFIDTLALQNFIVVGLSLGTNIACEALCKNNVSGVVLAGSCVIGGDCTLEDVFLSKKDTSILFADAVNADAYKNLLSSILTNRSFAKYGQGIINDYLRVKLPFRSSLLKSVLAKTYADGIGILKDFGKAVLIVFGENETLVKKDYLDKAGFMKWRDKKFLLPGADHFVNLDAPAEFNQLLFSYCNSVFYNQPMDEA
jgi:pimeloyl-ACP methyl ester carboxylesterase